MILFWITVSASRFRALYQADPAIKRKMTKRAITTISPVEELVGSSSVPDVSGPQPRYTCPYTVVVVVVVLVMVVVVLVVV